MKSLAALTAMLLTLAASAQAQEELPRIGPFVFDIRAAVPMFPNTSQQLADSRGLNLVQLPGTGIGGDIDAHVYLLRWKAVTLGVGGEAVFGRAQWTPGVTGGVADYGSAVTEEFKSIAPQISLNFGSGKGWSYISGGIGKSIWSIVADGQPENPSDSEPVRTINYGGGARWWPRPHLGVSLDVRFWQMDPGSPQLGFPGTPRTTLLVLSGGLSIK